MAWPKPVAGVSEIDSHDCVRVAVQAVRPVHDAARLSRRIHVAQLRHHVAAGGWRSDDKVRLYGTGEVKEAREPRQPWTSGRRREPALTVRPAVGPIPSTASPSRLGTRSGGSWRHRASIGMWSGRIDSEPPSGPRRACPASPRYRHNDWAPGGGHDWETCWPTCVSIQVTGGAAPVSSAPSRCLRRNATSAPRTVGIRRPADLLRGAPRRRERPGGGRADG